MTVYLVGAGPGDPGLLTLRGAELLASADVVVHDRLASPRLLDLAPHSAERIDVGKAPGRVAMSQADIDRLLVERGRTGATVIRLKGGDPFVFGRGGEEAEALIAAGVPFEVVPGVTSAVAAPAYAGIPVTHRGLSTHVTIVTGHEDPAKGTSDTDWAALARAGGTLVVLMGAGRVAEVARLLIAGGRAPETPVAAVRWGTHPHQRTIRATLAKIGSEAVEAPSAIVVGAVAALDLAWFEHRPLFGRRVVVTRAREQASGLRARLVELGAEVVELPTIEVTPLEFEVPELAGRDGLAGYGWVVLTSANGVDAFFTRGLHPRGLDARALAGVKVAAIGPGTAAALERFGVRADLVPERFVAEALVAAFPPPGVPRERVLLARAEQARDVLPVGLTDRGYDVDIVPVYRTVTGVPDAAELERVRAGEFDAVTFTSSSTVESFCRLVGPIPTDTLVVSIGPITSASAKAAGLRVDVEADPHDIDGLVAAVLAALEHR
ncbi:MAG: uroporphyrinogen methyltransferase / synthase [Actinomycetota bacterium]|nr:uroporphyrinogen methyltransferase / synthase [Actinomycetota bacterium]